MIGCISAETKQKLVVSVLFLLIICTIFARNNLKKSVMKYLKFTVLSMLTAVAMMAMSSCSSNDDDYVDYEVNLNETAIEYGDDDVWTGYMVADEVITSHGLVFSHAANPDWLTWSGFVPSRCQDNADYSAGNWLDHQFAAMPKGGLSGVGTPYFVAYWDSYSDSETDHTLAVKSVDDLTFVPQHMYVTNTSYVYYAIKNGTSWSKKFEPGDKFTLIVHGVLNGEDVSSVAVDLANYTESSTTLLDTWTMVDLKPLGEVSSIYFTFESTDSGQWGINTPTYVAIDRLKVRYQF